MTVDELYSKDNAPLLLVDHQVGIMERVVRVPPLDVVRGNVLALARVAQVLSTCLWF